MYTSNNQLKQINETEFKLKSITGFIHPEWCKDLREILINQDGISIYDLQTKPKRYIVGKTGFKLPYDLLTTSTFEQSIHLLQKLKDVAMGDAIGVWIDNGVAYFDVVDTYNYIDRALQVAEQRGEQAIYDRIDREVIQLEGVPQ